VLGYSAVQSGLAQLPLAATIAASATLALRVVVRVGYKATLVAGLAVVAAGLWWFGAVSPDGSFPGDLLGPSLVVGIGAGAVWVSSMVAATSGADAAEAGLASGLINTSQQLGGALGIAALVAVATARTASVLEDGADRLVAVTEGFRAGFAGGALVAATGAALAALLLSSATSRRHASAARASRAVQASRCAATAARPGRPGDRPPAAI
jgi:MFS family permease